MIRRLIFPALACCLLIPAAGCAFDTAGLSARQDGYYCGDGRVDDDTGEDCEGDDLQGRTCALLGYAGGTLACTADCRFDESACTGEGFCGDGVRNGDGANEDCDGDDLGGLTCVDRGFPTGTLACTEACRFDESGCEGEAPVCGDGQADGDETCDDGETDPCAGTCNADCTGPANTCGDGEVACGEACDLGDLQGADCTDFGYADPAGLACDACGFDISGCHSDCGDGVLDPGEVCEDGNTNDVTAGDDFCGPLCTTTTWACAGGWPGYFPPTNTAEPWVTFSDTVLNGSATRYATGAAGANVLVTVSYAYDAVASGCAGCRVQLYWGLFAGPAPASDADPNAGFKHCRDQVQAQPNATYSFSLTLPTQPGTYHLRWARSWEYSCNYNVDATDPDRDLAVICVY